MGNNFLSATANYDDYSKLASGEINSYVLKNNETGLKKTFTFFQGDSDILLLCGFAGVGKKQVAEHTLSYMDKNTIIMKYVCTESSKLDDIHLSFYNILRQKTSMKDTTEIDGFNEINDKINYILTKLDLNFIPVFYNFDNIKEENKQEIINYIFELSKKENIKTVIVARVFDTDIIPEEIKYVKVMIKALSKELFESYLKDYGIKITPQMLEQLYRLSRGYFYSACLTAKIILNQEYSINDFIVQYTNSGLKFDDFLAKTYYKLIVGTTKSAFNLFIKLHHGLNLKILQTIGSYPEVILKTLSENYYIYKKQGLYYPSEFLKLQLEQEVGDEISKNRLASYYEKQVELPPEERDFTISRATLQDEIALCKEINIHPEETESTDSASQTDAEVSAEKTETEEDLINLSTDDLINKAIENYAEFEYLKTIDILTILLSRKEELQNSNNLYNIYAMLAQTYEKLKKWKYALYYYDVLENHYSDLDKTESVHLIQFEKANIYYKSYQIINAIKLLKSLAANSKNKEVLVRSNILLGNIALYASNKDLAFQYYQEGINNIDKTTEKHLKMELYFKFAILADENNDMQRAIEFYQKCIDENDETSKYKALAYSNLADLFYDQELLDEAKNCFEKAFIADKINNNEYGMYYSLSKLIELTDKREKEKLLKMATEAKHLAVKTQDFNAIIDATIKLGDVYYDIPEPENALEQYLELYKMDKDKFGEENIKQLKSRLNDIKARLGKEKFEELVPNYE